MPATHHIDRDRKTIFVKASGILTLDDLVSDRRRMRDNPDFDPGYAFLMDLRDVTELRISSAELRALAAGSTLDRAARQAYVVPSDMAFGMARIYSVFSNANPGALQVFRDMDKARAWLGLVADGEKASGE